MKIDHSTRISSHHGEKIYTKVSVFSQNKDIASLPKTFPQENTTIFAAFHSSFYTHTREALSLILYQQCTKNLSICRSKNHKRNTMLFEDLIVANISYDFYSLLCPNNERNFPFMKMYSHDIPLNHLFDFTLNKKKKKLFNYIRLLNFINEK